MSFEDRIHKARNAQYQLKRHLEGISSFSFTGKAREEVKRGIALTKQLRVILLALENGEKK